MSCSTRSSRPFVGALLSLGLLASALLACKSNVRVAVDCKGNKTAIVCSVKHVEGNSNANACWDLHFTCQNGTLVTGSACQTVSKGATATKTIPLTQLTNSAQCDRVSSSEVKNLKITRQ